MENPPDNANWLANLLTRLVAQLGFLPNQVQSLLVALLVAALTYGFNTQHFEIWQLLGAVAAGYLNWLTTQQARTQALKSRQLENGAN